MHNVVLVRLEKVVMPWCNCLQFHCYHEKCLSTFPSWTLNYSVRSNLVMESNPFTSEFDDTVSVTNIEENAKSWWKTSIFSQSLKVQHLNKSFPPKTNTTQIRGSVFQTFGDLSTSQLAAVLYGTCTVSTCKIRLVGLLWVLARSWGIVKVGAELSDKTRTCSHMCVHKNASTNVLTCARTHARRTRRPLKNLNPPENPSTTSLCECTHVCVIRRPEASPTSPRLQGNSLH